MSTVTEPRFVRLSLYLMLVLTAITFGLTVATMVVSATQSHEPDMDALCKAAPMTCPPTGDPGQPGGPPMLTSAADVDSITLDRAHLASLLRSHGGRQVFVQWLRLWTGTH